MARRRYQTGRIIPVGKKYVGRYREDVILPDGKIRRVERSVPLGLISELKTERQARRFLEPYLAKVNDFAYRPSKFITIGKFADEWEDQVLINQKPSSVKAAKSHLRTHIRPFLGKVPLHEFTIQNQQRFVTTLGQKCVSRKTIQNVLWTLASMVRSAKKYGYSVQPIDTAELVIPQTLRKPTRFFSPDEETKIITVATQPYRAMFAIAAMTGLRIGEILALQKADLDFDQRKIHVRRSAWHGQIQTAKGPASQKPVVMAKDLVPFLEEYLAHHWRSNPEEFLFLNRRGRLYFANKVNEDGLHPVLDKLQIKRAGMHAFRRTHGSLLGHVKAGPAVMKAQMRHSDSRTTLDHYCDVIGDDQREAVDRVGEILRPFAPKSGSDGEYIQ